MSIDNRLGFLLKHVHQQLLEIAGPALAPHGINGRELAVLTVLGGETPVSQQEAARELMIDRTTMVALVDALESKGLVVRQPDPADRRRNLVQPTSAGQEVFAAATAARDNAEREFLAPLGPDGAREFMAALRTLLRRPA
jgi:DNA-binding MarR family transcriptional regulator